MCVKLTSLFDSKMKVFCVAQMFKQDIDTKMMCPNYILELRNTKWHL